MKPSESGVMHAVLHNFGDWEIETRHMSRIEKSIYFDMRTIYLKTGKSLKGDVGYLYRLFSCASEEEKAALDFVLSDKFTLDKKTNTYKQREWDTILKNYKYGNGIADGYTDKLRTQADTNTDTYGQNADTNTDAHNRRKAFNERLSIMVNALSDIGVKASIRDGSTKLKELCKQNQINVEQLFADTCGQNADTNTDAVDNDGQKNDEKNHAITNNQEPITINQEPDSNTHHTPTGGATEELPEGFQRFWETYPNHSGRRKDKHKCLLVWQKNKLESIADTIVQHVKAMSNTKKWRDGYEPLTMSYLNGKQWLDGLPEESEQPGVIYDKDGYPIAGFEHIDYTKGTYLREDGSRGF